MNRWTGLGLVAVATVTIIGVALAQQPDRYYADINGDGLVNSGDQGILGQQIEQGYQYLPNPCVPYVVVDDAHPWTPADGGQVINSLGEVWETPPRGGQYVVPPSHPAYAVLAEGTSWPLRACP